MTPSRFYVLGSHGQIEADSATGAAISYEPNSEGGKGYADILCFDVVEWHREYPGEELDHIDILDIGFWTDTGGYAEPVREFRVTVRNDNAMRRRPPITLSNGQVVVHALAANGSQDATMQDGGCMSHAESAEYARLLKAGAAPVPS